MEPDYKPKTVFSEPQPTQTASQYIAVPTPAVPQPEPQKSRKGLIIAMIIGGSVGLLLVVIAVILVTSGSSNNQSGDTRGAPQQAAILQPAQSIELEQVNSSISQDLSSLDDAKDFDNANLDDKTLGL